MLTSFRTLHILLRGNQDGAEVHLSSLELLQSLLDTLLGHGECLDDGPDAVGSGEAQHLAVDNARGDEGADDVDALGEEGHVRDLKVAGGDGERVDVGAHGEER